MKQILILLTILLSHSALAETLSAYELQAGKSVVATVLDSASADVTAQYNLSYAGPELKIIQFAGKNVLVGSIAGSYNITATKKSNLTTILFPVIVTPGTANFASLVSGDGQTVTAGTIYSNPFKIKVTDSFGNLIRNASVILSSNTATTSSLSAGFDNNNLASEFATAGTVIGRETFTATISSVGFSKTLSFFGTVVAPPNKAAKIVLNSQSSSVTQGGSVSLSIKALDSTGFLSPSYVGTVSVSGFKNSSCTVASSSPLSGTPSVSASSGIASFSNIVPAAVEPLYIKVSAAGLPAICTQAISVFAPVTGLSSLKITQFPTLLKINANFFPAIKVQELDNNGQLMSSATDSITITNYDDSNCSIQSSVQLSNSSGSAVSGFATFSKLQSASARTIYLKASSGATKSACSAALVVLGPVPTIYAAGTNWNYPDYAAGNSSTLDFWGYSWSNGVETRISNSIYSGDITINGHDVYVAGETIHGPAYWKNGIQVDLPTANRTTDGYGWTQSIRISGSDVYAFGIDNNYVTAYWKNGIEVPLINFDGSAEMGVNNTGGIVIIGSDVYTTGRDVNGRAAYWKNGIRQSLALTGLDSISQKGGLQDAASDSSGNLYLIGYIESPDYVQGYGGTSPVLTVGFVTGFVYKINPGTGVASTTIFETFLPYRIAVSGSDVYLLGYKAVGNYSFVLKNGIETELTSTDTYLYGQSIAVNGSDVYVGAGGTTGAFILKNGVKMSTIHSDVDGRPYSISIGLLFQ